MIGIQTHRIGPITVDKCILGAERGAAQGLYNGGPAWQIVLESGEREVAVYTRDDVLAHEIEALGRERLVTIEGTEVTSDHHDRLTIEASAVSAFE